MKNISDFGIYDFSDFADELDEEQLVSVNGGRSYGQCGSGSPATTSAPNQQPSPFIPASGMTSHTTNTSGTATCGGTYSGKSLNEQLKELFKQGKNQENINNTNDNWNDKYGDKNTQSSNLLAKVVKGIAFALGLEYSDKYADCISPYGKRDPIDIDGKMTKPFHSGLDIAAVEGERINAVMNGTVESVNYNNDVFGNYIVIRHQNGSRTLYAHCSSLDVDVGASVVAGEKIAEVGSTGMSTGPHLHLGYDGNGDGKYDNPFYDNPERLFYACY